MASSGQAAGGAEGSGAPQPVGGAGGNSSGGTRGAQDKALSRSGSGGRGADDRRPLSPGSGPSASADPTGASSGGGVGSGKSAATESERSLSRSTSGRGMPAGARAEQEGGLGRSASGKAERPGTAPKPGAVHVAPGKGPAQAGTRTSPRPEASGSGGGTSAGAGVRSGRGGGAAAGGGERAKGVPARPQGSSRPLPPGDRAGAKAPSGAATRPAAAAASGSVARQPGRHPSGALSSGSAKGPSPGGGGGAREGDEAKGAGPGGERPKKRLSLGAMAREVASAKGKEGARSKEGASGSKSWMRDGSEFQGVTAGERLRKRASLGEATKGGAVEKGAKGGGAPGDRSWMRDGSEFDGVSDSKKRPAPGAPAAAVPGSSSGARRESDEGDAQKAKGRASTEQASAGPASVPAPAAQQQPHGAGEKAKQQPPAPATGPGVHVPEVIEVRCLDLVGQYMPAAHKVRCVCAKECAGAPGGAKEVSLSEFEVHAGCRRKYWKESVSVAGTGESLHNWLQNLADAGADLAFKSKGAKPRAPPSSAPAASRAGRAHDSSGALLPSPPDVLSALRHGSHSDSEAAGVTSAFPHAPLFQRLQAPWPPGRCCVCNSEEEDDGGCTFFTCCSCGIWVHRECYGVPEAAGTDLWLCRRCTHQGEKGAAASDPGPECCLCPVAGGALKPSTVPGLWVHLVCALWLPEPGVQGEAELEPVEGLESIELDRFRILACGVCRQPQGACLQCDALGCAAAYHATCAMRAGFLMDLLHRDTSDGSAQVLKCTFCPLHRTPYSSLANIWTAAEEAASRLKARGGSLKGGASITPPQEAYQTHVSGTPQPYPAVSGQINGSHNPLQATT